MKTITAILLTIATLAAAVPSPNSEINPAILETRQACTYACGCQQLGDGDGIDPDTAKCCVSGTLGNEGSLCTDMDFNTAKTYGQCCGDSGGFLCFQSAPTCPPVII